MMPCASHSDLTSDGIQKMISSWLLECRVVAISNITIICRDIDHSQSQSKKNKATICCCLCFDDGREMSNPMTSSEQKETLEQVWTFLRDVVTHHFLFSGLTSKLGRTWLAHGFPRPKQEISLLLLDDGQKTRLSAEFSLSAFLRKSFEWIWFGDTFFEWLTATDVVQWQSGENSNFSPNEQFGK